VADADARAGAHLFHHDLCFGCGQANPFGLQLELAPSGSGAVEGRFFVKQDHQGPPGYAHGGVIGAALDEAMALVLHHEGIPALTARLEVELRESVPVGTFVQLVARIAERGERRLRLSAEAVGQAGGVAARAEGIFIRPLANDPREDTGPGPRE
jgi:acyl-coenzyme A thioesterase PaaI-like protein